MPARAGAHIGDNEANVTVLGNVYRYAVRNPDLSPLIIDLRCPDYRGDKFMNRVCALGNIWNKFE